MVRGNLDVLEFGALSFAVNPSLGARITSFKLDGDELLTDATANPKFFGSTLWTSPASDWVVPGTFVPPAIVDSDPYTATVSADGVITATSKPSTANNKHLVISKVFHADLAKNAIVIDYKITNTGPPPSSFHTGKSPGVWPNGLMFFPSGTMTKLDFLAQLVQVKQAQGYTWYDNTTHMMGKGESKAGTDSSGGFIAQVAPHTKGDLLFIKAFREPPQPRHRPATTPSSSSATIRTPTSRSRTTARTTTSPRAQRTRRRSPGTCAAYRLEPIAAQAARRSLPQR